MKHTVFATVTHGRTVVESMPASCELYELAHEAVKASKYDLARQISDWADEQLVFEMERSLDHERAPERR